MAVSQARSRLSAKMNSAAAVNQSLPANSASSWLGSPTHVTKGDEGLGLALVAFDIVNTWRLEVTATRPLIEMVSERV